MKISKHKQVEKIVMKTKTSKEAPNELSEWWKNEDDNKLAMELCGTAAYLKTSQTYRMRQLAVDVRLYCGLSVYSYAGSNVSKMNQTKTLPDDRPTFNLIQSCTDTLVSRLSQSRPAPIFLTDDSDYKTRHLAQEMNKFILGEFYQTKAYEKSVKMLRDCIVMGTGVLKVYETDEGKVGVDRVLATDLFVDPNDAINGEPQQLYQLKLVDREKLISRYPKYKKMLTDAPNAYPDNSPDTGKTTADQIMIVEGWKLPSAPEAKDGRHTIACVSGILLDEVWEKEKFPFVFMNYSEPFLGFFGQGLATQLFGTQITLNRILWTIAKCLMLTTPKILVESSSKVNNASLSNELYPIIKYTGIKPEFVVHNANAADLYQERDKLIQYGYQQCGVSAMAASSMKPEGLDSGEAIRSYDQISTDRFAELSRKYDNVFIDLAYMITDKAIEIAKRDGKYQTVYPNKDGTKEINLPKMTFLKDPFVIQCFNESSLPRDPAGRAAKITEMVQSGMISLKEGRRLLGSLDNDQMDRLANASEERIFQYLDEIVESGKYNPPDVFMEIPLAEELTVQYINLYMSANLEEEKTQLLRNFWTQLQVIKQAAMPQPIGGAPIPQAQPEALPTSPLVPNAVTAA